MSTGYIPPLPLFFARVTAACCFAGLATAKPLGANSSCITTGAGPHTTLAIVGMTPGMALPCQATTQLTCQLPPQHDDHHQQPARSATLTCHGACVPLQRSWLPVARC